MFIQFTRQLRDYGVPVGVDQLLELYRGLEKGLARNVDALYLLSRLVFIKRVEHMDAFDRAFALHFHGIDLPPVKEGDPQLLHTKQFREWLEKAIESGELPRHAPWTLPYQELMKKFWETVKEQMEAHHGGNRWVGTGGSSPFGHSGAPQPGVRVHGESRHRSALKVIGERRYIEYSGENILRGENIRQAVGLLKRMVPAGPATELDVDETVYQSARNGGEIELIFRRELRDRMRVILLLDNGGSSMLPWVELTRLLFSKLTDRFEKLETYFFHNTIYGAIYRDARRREPIPTADLLLKPRETRVLVVGDATMAPEELTLPRGSVDWDAADEEPSQVWLERLQGRFPHMVWLNPIPNIHWGEIHGAWTLAKIRDLIPMEDLTLRGIQRAVERLND